MDRSAYCRSSITSSTGCCFPSMIIWCRTSRAAPAAPPRQAAPATAIPCADLALLRCAPRTAAPRAPATLGASAMSMAVPASTTPSPPCVSHERADEARLADTGVAADLNTAPACPPMGPRRSRRTARTAHAHVPVTRAPRPQPLVCQATPASPHQRRVTSVVRLPTGHPPVRRAVTWPGMLRPCRERPPRRGRVDAGPWPHVDPQRPHRAAAPRRPPRRSRKPRTRSTLAGQNRAGGQVADARLVGEHAEALVGQRVSAHFPRQPTPRTNTSVHSCCCGDRPTAAGAAACLVAGQAGNSPLRPRPWPVQVGVVVAVSQRVAVRASPPDPRDQLGGCVRGSQQVGQRTPRASSAAAKASNVTARQRDVELRHVPIAAYGRRTPVSAA